MRKIRALFLWVFLAIGTLAATPIAFAKTYIRCSDETLGGGKSIKILDLDGMMIIETEPSGSFQKYKISQQSITEPTDRSRRAIISISSELLVPPSNPHRIEHGSLSFETKEAILRTNAKWKAVIDENITYSSGMTIRSQVTTMCSFVDTKRQSRKGH